MAHNTFISYKYSEARDLRDEIIYRLGDYAKYYRGEYEFSDDLSSLSSYYIKEYLKRMIKDTTVTIVIVSPNMLLSKWIEWELSYSLSEITRNDRTSHTNGIVAVIQKYFGSYSWIRTWYGWDYSKMYGLITENTGNVKPSFKGYLDNDYVEIVTEDDFLSNPKEYIDRAFEKSEYSNCYDISKRIY